MSHTKAPWQLDEGGQVIADGFVIGCVYGAIPEAGEDHECLANGRLITAAPDMLNALRLIQGCAIQADSEERFGEAVTEVLDAVNAAVAKAEGRS